MNISDIRTYIADNINDVEALVNYCNLDKTSRNICSNKTFWLPMFNKWGLPINLINLNTNNTDEWIKQFVDTYDAMTTINIMMVKRLPNNMIV